MNINKLNPYALRLHAGRGPGGAGASGAGAGTGAGGGAAGAPAGTFLLDTFSSSSAQDLDGRTGEIGATWTYDSVGALTLQGGLLATASDSAFYALVDSSVSWAYTDVAISCFLADGGLVRFWITDGAQLSLVTPAAQQTLVYGDEPPYNLSAHPTSSGLALVGSGVVYSMDYLEAGPMATFFDADGTVASSWYLRVSRDDADSERGGWASFSGEDGVFSGAMELTLEREYPLPWLKYTAVALVDGGSIRWQIAWSSDGNIPIFGLLNTGAHTFAAKTGSRVYEEDTEYASVVQVTKIRNTDGVILGVVDLELAVSEYSQDIDDVRLCLDDAGFLYAVRTFRSPFDGEMRDAFVVKIDATTLDVVWKFTTTLGAGVAFESGVATVVDGVVILAATFDTYDAVGLIALETDTGGLAWQTRLDVTFDGGELALPRLSSRPGAVCVQCYTNLGPAAGVAFVLPTDGSGAGVFSTFYSYEGASMVTGVSSTSATITNPTLTLEATEFFELVSDGPAGSAGDAITDVYPLEAA